jgi:lipoyl(octanoyl) transferase
MVEWRHLPGLSPYPETLAAMEAHVAAMNEGRAGEAIWLLEHPPLYTAGTSARPADLVQPDRFPVHSVGRGGQYTYHGPGQRVIYTMLDVKARGGDVRCFVRELEQWVIDTLAEFNVTGEIRPGRVGVWVQRPDRPGPDGTPSEDKIAAIGIKLRRWVSLVDLGLPVTLADLDAALVATFPRRFQDRSRAA